MSITNGLLNSDDTVMIFVLWSPVINFPGHPRLNEQNVNVICLF